MLRVHTLDLQFQNTPGVIAAFLVEADGALALVETGPGSTLPTLLEQIKTHGVEPGDIKQVFVTHIHLDHGGAAGWWAQQGATVYAHPRATPHLIDPSKLIDSAKRVYGDKMDSLWGTMLPAPEDKVVALKDGETVKVGKSTFTAIDTPGHARHHHAFACEDICFTGDVAGVRLERSDYISVAAAPPQFDPVAYVESITKLHDQEFAKLYLTHFGEVSDVDDHLSRYALRVEQVHDTIREMMELGGSGAGLRHSYTATESAVAIECGVSDALWQRYQIANHTGMCADGIALFVEKHPA